MIIVMIIMMIIYNYKFLRIFLYEVPKNKDFKEKNDIFLVKNLYIYD
jgi:hypothetical protein